MKTKAELNTLKNEVEALNRKFAVLNEDELGPVTGGAHVGGVCGPDYNSTLDRILFELSAWLDAHPNATKSDIYNLLKEKKEVYADKLTVDELSVLDEILSLYAS